MLPSEHKPVLVESAKLAVAPAASGLWSPRRRRVLFASLSVLLGLAYARWDLQLRLADAETLGRTLAALLREEPLPPSDVGSGFALEPALDVVGGGDPSLTAEELSAPALARGKKPKHVASNTPSAVFVPSSTVLRLANARLMPAGAWVPTEGTRPSGLRLSGVSRLALGVHDGDVLTEVAGVPVSSVASVVSIVLRLRAQKAPGVQGTLWRGKVAFPITVEMPYPPLSPAPVAPNPAQP